MGMYDGYENTQPEGGRGNAPPINGDFACTITRIECKTLRSGIDAVSFYYKVDENRGGAAAVVGAEYECFQGYFHPDAARAAVLAILIALAGQKQGEPGAERVKAQAGAFLRAAGSAANPFAGFRFLLKTTLRESDDGGKFTKQTFYYLPECSGQLDAMIAAVSCRPVAAPGAPPPPPPPPPPPGPLGPLSPDGRHWYDASAQKWIAV